MGAKDYTKTALKRIQKLLQNKRYLMIALGVLILLLSGVVFLLSSKPERSVSKGRTDLEVVKNVPFKTVLPKNTSIDKLGGWRRISPSDSDPVVAYSDRLASVAITVSEQPVPRSLGGDGDKLADLAHKFNATDKLNIKGTTTYIGTSANGPQSVILIKNNLLILIRSKAKIDDNSWIRYITSLE